MKRMLADFKFFLSVGAAAMRLLLPLLLTMMLVAPGNSVRAQPFFLAEERGCPPPMASAAALTVLVVGGVVVADVLSGGTLTAPLWAMLGLEVTASAPFLRRALPAAAVGAIPVSPPPAAPTLRAIAAIR